MPIFLPLPARSLGTASRFIGSIGLDDNVNALITQVTIPSTRDVQFEQHQGRRGRMSRIKEDNTPLVVSVTGYFKETPSTGVYWWDWRAAILNQSRAPFILGDGTRYEYVDVTSLEGAQVASAGAGTPTPERLLAFVMKVSCYEPFSREISPSLTSLGALNSSNGTSTTNVSVSYSGTAFAEPTWQFTLVVPAAKFVTAVSLRNTITGEQCSIACSLGVGTWHVLMDASGGYIPLDGSAPPTPNNNGYGLLATPSLGDGVTVALSGGGSVDTDFSGNPPTLVPSATPTVPATAYSNTLVASITATAVLTSASLSCLAPARYQR